MGNSGGILTLRTVRSSRPTCRLNGPMGNISISVAVRFSLYFLIMYQNHLYSLLFVTSGVFWGGIRYSLHVFTGDHWNVPWDITRVEVR